MTSQQADKYCPECKKSHTFIKCSSGISNCFVCKNTGLHFSSETLSQAFLSLRKDPEYADRGISMETVKKAYKNHEHTMKKLAPNDTSKSAALTLPIDSEERKGYPILSGCLKYFAAALASVARTSKLGNDKHNPGEPLHHARGKSMDHGDCIIRHLMDIEDMLAANERYHGRSGNPVEKQPFSDRQILDEAGSLAWRALAYSQELHERLGVAPLAPGAKE